jgi:hypothetical protein
MPFGARRRASTFGDREREADCRKYRFRLGLGVRDGVRDLDRDLDRDTRRSRCLGGLGVLARLGPGCIRFSAFFVSASIRRLSDLESVFLHTQRYLEPAPLQSQNKRVYRVRDRLRG